MTYHAGMPVCYHCGASLPPRETIFRATVCEECGRDVRCCKNCDFYAPGAHWDCRETIQEPVRDKERANFCDHFRPGSQTSQSGTPASNTSGREKFNKLFDD